MKKAAAGLLAGIMVLTLAACGSKKEEVKNSKEYVYRGEEIALEEIEDTNSISGFRIVGDRMFITGYNWDENGKGIFIVSRSLDGSDTSTVPIELEESQSFSNITVDEAGNIIAVCNEYFEDDSDPDNYIWEDNYYLLMLDPQGKELWKQQLNDTDSEEYYSIYSLELLTDGRILLIDAEAEKAGIKIFGTDGSLAKSVSIQEEWTAGQVYQLKDGTVIADMYVEETGKYSLRKLDVETGELSQETYMVPGTAGNYSYYPGVGVDLLLVDSMGVSAYNLGDEEVRLLMNFIDSDLNASYIYNVQAVSETEFYGMINDDLTGKTVLMKFTKVRPEDVVEKTVLTLASNGINWDVRNQVVRFNKSSEKYRIRIHDYSQYNTDEDYNAGTTRMNADIAAGRIPDILVLDSNFPIENYSSKGLFENLYPYIDNDEGLNRENYLGNIFQALETNGKLYRLVPSFAVLTVAGKSEDVGTKPGWTLKELNQAMDKKKEGTQVFTQEIRSSVLNYSMQMSSEQFIDWETGKCSFNSEGFMELLEFLKQFPEQYDEEYYNDSFWRDYNSLWREDAVLLRIFSMDSFDSYNYTKKGVFGTDITLIGFPSENKNGSSIMPNLDMVMSAKSSHKDGAWEFMRYFLSDEYQDTIEYGWPLSKKRIGVLAENSKKRPSYEDEDGNVIEYDQTYFIGSVEVPITPMTDKEIEEVTAFLESLQQVYTYDANLINIISEEAAPYFAGQKNAQEAADIIQNRVQIYVDENR